MSDTELTEEQLKEQKLEEARKKYEALKKKTKKKNKKSKKKEDDDAEGKYETPEADVKEQTPAAEENEEEDKADEEEEIPAQVATEETNEIETAVESAEAVDQPNEESVEESKALTEPVEETTVEETTPAEPISQLTEEVKNIDISKETKPADDTENPFASSGPSFMETIQQSKKAQQEDEVKRLKQENLQLKFDQEELEEKITSLTKENKELKFIKLDHQEQIETLEAQVADLQAKLARAKVDSSSSRDNNQQMSTPYDFDENVSLSPTPSYTQPQFSTSFSQFNMAKNDSTLSLSEIKARLNKWKGWNVDMSSWRSVGSGPVVEL